MTYETNKKLVFVLMPFREKLQNVYEKIKDTVQERKLSCLRCDDIFSEGLIIKQIWENIYKSQMVIADATGQNANVFYEIGLAHAMGKPVIIISQNKDDIPFNIRGMEFIIYENNKQGLKKLGSDLSKAIDDLKWIPPKINKWIKTNNKDIIVGLSFPTDNIEVNTYEIEGIGQVVGLNNEQLSYRIRGFVRVAPYWWPEYPQGTSHIDEQGFWKIEKIYLGASVHKLYFKIFDQAERTVAESTKIKVIKISR